MIATTQQNQSGTLPEFIRARNIWPMNVEQMEAFASELHAMLVQLVCDEGNGFNIQAQLSLPHLKGNDLASAFAWILSVHGWYDGLLEGEKDILKEARFSWV